MVGACTLPAGQLARRYDRRLRTATVANAAAGAGSADEESATAVPDAVTDGPPGDATSTSFDDIALTRRRPTPSFSFEPLKMALRVPDLSISNLFGVSKRSLARRLWPRLLVLYARGGVYVRGDGPVLVHRGEAYCPQVEAAA